MSRFFIRIPAAGNPLATEVRGKRTQKMGDGQIYLLCPGLNYSGDKIWRNQQAKRLSDYRCEHIGTRILNHAYYHPVMVSSPFLRACGRPDEGIGVSDLPQTMSYSFKLINNGKASLHCIKYIDIFLPSLPWFGPNIISDDYAERLKYL